MYLNAFGVAALALLFQPSEPARIERVAGRLTYAEGPLWAREGYLLFTDAPNDKIYKLSSGGKPEVFRDNSQGTSGITFDAQGRLYMCESKSRRLTRLDKKGNLEVLAEKWQGKRLNAPNDVIVRKDGQIFFTDPAFGYQQDHRELDFYGVYRISSKGEMSLVAKAAGRPNGIALSPNGRTLYVSNSDEHNVRAYDVDKEGSTSNERVVISDIKGVPNGLRVDEKGHIYVSAQEVFVYDHIGKLISTIPVGQTPASCAFGDPDYGTLYITARDSVYRFRLDVKGSVQY